MKKLIAMLVLLWCGWLGMGGGSPVYALDFAVYPLEELAQRSDTIVVGTVVDQKDMEDRYKIYRVAVQLSLKGEAKAGSGISVSVLQWADEGVLHEGKQYLFMLKEQEKEHQIMGVHQGFILVENGTTQSRFYSPEEVDRFLQAQGASLESFPAPVAEKDRVAMDGGSSAPALPVTLFWTVLIVGGYGVVVSLMRRSRRR
jgi:hypothetical protein